MHNQPKIIWPNRARIAVVIQVSFDQVHGDRALRGEAWQGSDMPAPSHRFRNPDDLLTESRQAYGEVGLWRVTELLDRYRTPATGVFSALAVERYPDAVNSFVHGSVAREACGHSYAQDVPVHTLSADAMRDNIKRCVDIFGTIMNVRPAGWVSPGGRFKADTPRLLAEHGFIYHGDYANSDAPFPIDVGGPKFVGMSVPWDTNDTMHDKYGAAPGRYVEMFCRSFDTLYAEGGQVLGFVIHPAQYGRPFGISACQEIIGYARRHPDVWFATREQIARWYIDTCL